MSTRVTFPWSSSVIRAFTMPRSTRAWNAARGEVGLDAIHHPDRPPEDAAAGFTGVSTRAARRNPRAARARAARASGRRERSAPVGAPARACRRVSGGRAGVGSAFRRGELGLRGGGSATAGMGFGGRHHLTEGAGGLATGAACGMGGCGLEATGCGSPLGAGSKVESDE
jgi:hypothetical protein